MRRPSTPCAPFRDRYHLLPLLRTDGQLHRIAIRYGYRLPTLFLGQRLGADQGLSPAHDTSADSERLVLRAPSLDEVSVAGGDLESLVSDKHKAVPLQHVEPGFVRFPRLDRLERGCQVGGKAGTELALGWQSKRVLQRARGFVWVEDGKIDQLGEPFGLDELGGGEEGCHVGGSERVGRHEVVRDVRVQRPHHMNA